MLSRQVQTLNFLSQRNRNVIIHTVQDELIVSDKECAATSIDSTDCDEPLLKKTKKGPFLVMFLGLKQVKIHQRTKVHREVTKYVALEPVQNFWPLEQ